MRAGNGLLSLSHVDIISIRSSEANQGDEMKQGKLRCPRVFRNKEQKQDAERWWEQVLLSGSGYILLQPPSPLLSSSQTHNCSKMLPDPEVPRKETAFTVASVVYNSL